MKFELFIGSILPGKRDYMSGPCSSACSKGCLLRHETDDQELNLGIGEKGTFYDPLYSEGPKNNQDRLSNDDRRISSGIDEIVPKILTNLGQRTPCESGTRYMTQGVKQHYSKLNTKVGAKFNLKKQITGFFRKMRLAFKKGRPTRGQPGSKAVPGGLPDGQQQGLGELEVNRKRQTSCFFRKMRLAFKKGRPTRGQPGSKAVPGGLPDGQQQGLGELEVISHDYGFYRISYLDQPDVHKYFKKFQVTKDGVQDITEGESMLLTRYFELDNNSKNLQEDTPSVSSGLAGELKEEELNNEVAGEVLREGDTPSVSSGLAGELKEEELNNEVAGEVRKPKYVPNIPSFLKDFKRVLWSDLYMQDLLENEFYDETPRGELREELTEEAPREESPRVEELGGHNNPSINHPAPFLPSTFVPRAKSNRRRNKMIKKKKFEIRQTQMMERLMNQYSNN